MKTQQVEAFAHAVVFELWILIGQNVLIEFARTVALLHRERNVDLKKKSVLIVDA